MRVTPAGRRQGRHEPVGRRHHQERGSGYPTLPRIGGLGGRDRRGRFGQHRPHVEICRELGRKGALDADWPGFGRAEESRAGSAPQAIGYSRWTRTNGSARAAAIRDPRDCCRAAVTRRVSHPALVSVTAGASCATRGWWPDHVRGCFKRGARALRRRHRAREADRAGPVGTLSQPLLHEAFTDLEEVLGKVNRYSSAGAQMMRGRGPRRRHSRARWRTAPGPSCAPMCCKAGILDGREGFMLAVSNAEGVYYRVCEGAVAGESAR